MALGASSLVSFVQGGRCELDQSRLLYSALRHRAKNGKKKEKDLST